MDIDQEFLEELKTISRKLEKLENIEGRLEKLDNIDGKLNKLENIEERLITLENIDGKLDKLESIDERLDGIEKTVKTMQKDISNINKHIEKGIYVDLDRVKERLTNLEQKIV